MNEKIGSIGVFPERAGVLRLDDGNGSSFYLLEGKGAAVLIDTGMANEPLRPVIEQLTRKPVTLLITHAHPDHMRHADEFDTVYLHEQDIPLLPNMCNRMGIQQNTDNSRYQRFQDGDRLSIDDLTICAFGLSGHTAGSTLFYVPSGNLLFTGDAVGSGAGVWMHLMESLSIAQYLKSLQNASAFLASLPQPPTIFTGHYGQRYMKPGTDNPVCLALLKDMETLCRMILDHKETRKDAPAAFLRGMRPAYVAEYGRASIVYSEETIAKQHKEGTPYGIDPSI